MFLIQEGERPQDDHNGVWLGRKGSQALAVSVIFTGLAACFVSARVYTRRYLIKHMQPNDWMVVVALMFSFIFMSFFIVEAVHGIGMHQTNLPQRVSREQLKAFYLTIPFYNISLFCAKASILLQYHRVFPSRAMRLTCTIFLAILATYGTWAVVTAFLTCVPVRKFWEPISGGFCFNMKALWFSNACMHILTDLAVLVIPIPALTGLGMPLRQRVAIIVIFALGGFVCITSIVRLHTLDSISESTDPTYDNIKAATWSAIECNTGIICACLPTLRPLCSKFLPTCSILPTYAPRTRSLNTISGGRRRRREQPSPSPSSSPTTVPARAHTRTRTTAPVPVPVPMPMPKPTFAREVGGKEQANGVGLSGVGVGAGVGAGGRGKPSPRIAATRPGSVSGSGSGSGSGSWGVNRMYRTTAAAGGGGCGKKCYDEDDDDDDEDELEEERMLAMVQQQKLGCRLSKESNAAATETTMTTMATTLRGDERWSSVSSGPTQVSGKE